MHAPLLVLVTGDPVPPVQRERGGFPELIQGTVGDAWQGNWHVVDARTDALTSVAEWAGVIITGSPASLTERAPWMDSALTYVRQLVELEVPTLGICFGHQLLGEALGGRVERNPAGREIGSVRLHVSDHCHLLPTAAEHEPSVVVNMTHVDTVMRLPSGARVLARTDQDPHAFVQFGRAAWGVQFHPEMDANVIRHYIAYRQEDLVAEGIDVSRALGEASETPAASQLLTKFALGCAERAHLRRPA